MYFAFYAGDKGFLLCALDSLSVRHNVYFQYSMFLPLLIYIKCRKHTNL